MSYVEIQTLEAHGIPCTEYRYEPELEYEQQIELGDTQYITSVKDRHKRRNRYIVMLTNRFTGKDQRVDLVMQESGFVAMISEIRKHFGYAWEVFSWTDCDAPF
jgi:hypothetical protein